MNYKNPLSNDENVKSMS